MPLTYGRMVLRQHATKELQHPFLHRKRFVVPSEVGVRRSKIAHRRACTSNQTQKHTLTILNHNTQHCSTHALHLCQDGPQAARDDGTPAPFHASQALRCAFRVWSTSLQDCPSPCLHVKSNTKTYPHNPQTQHATLLHTCPSPMSGWSSGSTRRSNSSTLSCIASASLCLP